MYAKLAPNTPIHTPAGQAVFEQYKPGNFLGQNVRVRLPNGTTRWFREADLKAAEKEFKTLKK